MSENCDVIAIFPIYGQFGVIWKPDSGRIVCKTYVLYFILNNHYLQISRLVLDRVCLGSVSSL